VVALICPATSSLAEGVNVPIPTLFKNPKSDPEGVHN